MKTRVSTLAALLIAGSVIGAFGIRQIGFAQDEDSSPSTNGVVARGDQLSRRVQGMMDEARREGDIIRVTCLNAKLTEINAKVRDAESRAKSLKEAEQGGDVGRRNHETTLLEVIGRKLSTLEKEANQCVGQDLYDTGETRVITEIDVDMDQEIALGLTLPQVNAVPLLPPVSSRSI